jgi:hypothetical protein
LIASLHLAEVGKRPALALLRRTAKGLRAPGLRYGVVTTTAPLGGHYLPRPGLGRVGLIAMWESEPALDDFLADHALARALEDGWRVRLQPTHVFGSWPRLDDLVPRKLAMSDDEPAAVITLGRLRLSQTLRFLRSSAAAEALAVRQPALRFSTGLARPPAIVATFSLWQSTAAMRDYASGTTEPDHRAASLAHARRPFHHESTFMRFRPYSTEGSWPGVPSLPASLAQA